MPLLLKLSEILIRIEERNGDYIETEKRKLTLDL